MKRDFTASVYLIEKQRVLLIFHPKLQKWLPPGGHMEKDELPSETARREALEEAGIEFEFCLQENIYIDSWNAKSIERPYLCLLEDIPAYGDQAAHQHIDFVFIGKPVKEHGTSSLSYRWFDKEQLLLLEPDSEIFQETLDVIDHLFQVFARPNEALSCLQ